MQPVQRDQPPSPPGRIDVLLPKDMARLAERTGTEKAEQDGLNLLAPGALAGAFIAFGATFAAAVIGGADPEVPWGLANAAAAPAFTLAYVLAIAGGAELVALVYWFVYLRPARG